MAPVDSRLALLTNLMKRNVATPWTTLEHWGPFRIDALGLITLLGAEEVTQSTGSLVKRKVTECLPLLGAWMVAGDRFMDRQTGYDMYDLTNGIRRPQLAGWFTRWLGTQDVARHTTVFEWSHEPPVSASGSMGRELLAVMLGCILLLPLLALTVLIRDGWGVANTVAILVSICVRRILFSQRRAAIECLITESVNNAKLHGDHGITATEPETCLLLVATPKGNLVTMRVPDNMMSCFIRDAEVPAARLYQYARLAGWLAFAVHAIALGMASLFAQLYTVVLLLGCTLLVVQRFRWDFPSEGCVSTEDMDCARRTQTSRPFGNVVFVKRHDYDGWDRRMNAYARAQLTKEQEEMMRDWGLTPSSSSRNAWWFEDYHALKVKYEARDHDQRTVAVRNFGHSK